MAKLLGIAVLLVFFVGCAGENQSVKINSFPSEPPVKRVHYTSLKPASEGSLWPGDNVRGGKLFEDRKAHYLGDILTVIISEDISAVGEAKTNINGQNEDTYSFPYIGGRDASKWKRNWEKFIKNTRENKFKGEGTTSRRNKITAVISVRVVDVLPDGNLVIAGKKSIKINGETQYLIISGIVRPDDINFDNTVESRYIADMRVEYTGKGVLAVKQKTGWGTKILNLLWPF